MSERELCAVPGCCAPANHSQAHNALAVAYEALDLLEGFAPEDVEQLRRRADFIRKATSRRGCAP